MKEPCGVCAEVADEDSFLSICYPWNVKKKLYLQSEDLTSMVALYQANLSFIWSATRVKYL